MADLGLGYRGETLTATPNDTHCYTMQRVLASCSRSRDRGSEGEANGPREPGGETERQAEELSARKEDGQRGHTGPIHEVRMVAHLAQAHDGVVVRGCLDVALPRVPTHRL